MNGGQDENNRHDNVGSNANWDDKSIDNIFRKQKEKKAPPITEAPAPSPTAPKKILIRQNAAMEHAVPKKRQTSLARRRYQQRKAQALRRRRTFVLILAAVALLILILITIAGVKAVQKRFAARDKSKDSVEDTLTDLKAFQKSDDVFYTATSNETITLLQQMLHTFTLADDGNTAVPTMKKEPSGYEWDMMKFVWYGDRTYLSSLKESIKEIAIAKNGYVWSEEKSAASTVSGSYLYDTNLKFISAVSGICLWDANTDFLSSKDTTTSGALDISQGKTVGEKLEIAVNYVLTNQYNTQTGLFAETYAANNGTSKGSPSNNWFNYRFGNLDAYNNIYFNNAMVRLTKLYQLIGDTEKASHYGSIAEANRHAFQTFWENDKGRFIGAIDTNGKKHDYGFTFLNLEAIYYGLSDSGQTKNILDWLDGTRIVASDTSKGNDIYANRYAPRNNTLTADPNWWYDQDDKRLIETNAAFGSYYQNGGSSLLTAFYDIMARFESGKTASAFTRIKDLTAEYKKDKLLRNRQNDTYAHATDGPFPESGLAPAVYVYGLIGVNTDGKTLSFTPRLPDGLGRVGLKKISFSNNSYNLLLDGKTIYLTADNYAPVRVRFGGFKAGQKVTYSYYEKDKKTLTDIKTADGGGSVYIEEAFGKDSFIKLSAEKK